MENLRKSIVSFDIDMTLLDHGTWTIPGSALEAIEKLRRNHLIVVATGRDMDAGYSVKIRDQLRPDAIIHSNGTRITAAGKEIYQHLFDKGLLGQMLAYVEKGKACSLGASIGDQDYFTNPLEVSRHDMELWGRSFRSFQDPWQLMDMPVRTLAYIGDEAGAGQIQSHFPQVSLYLFSQKRGADVVEKTASKAMGLKRLCKYYGVALEDTVAFGDSMNDWGILQAAGTGVAMGNAMEELKAVADYVADRIDQDGVWKACCHLGLLEKV